MPEIDYVQRARDRAKKSQEAIDKQAAMWAKREESFKKLNDNLKQYAEPLATEPPAVEKANKENINDKPPPLPPKMSKEDRGELHDAQEQAAKKSNKKFNKISGKDSDALLKTERKNQNETIKQNFEKHDKLSSLTGKNSGGNSKANDLSGHSEANRVKQNSIKKSDKILGIEPDANLKKKSVMKKMVESIRAKLSHSLGSSRSSDNGSESTPSVLRGRSNDKGGRF